MDVIKDLLQVKEIVRKCLKLDVKSRNSDTHLILKVWTEVQKVPPYALVEKEHLLISAESIRRVRQEIQNKELTYLPTRVSVLVNRRFKESQLKIYFGEDHAVYKDFVTSAYGVK